MKDDLNTNGISRRKFLNRFGTGVVGSVVVPPALKAFSNNIPKEIKDFHEGKVELKLTVNGKNVHTLISPDTTLVELIRDDLKLTGTKITCNQGECGGCTVIVDGKPIYSCHTLALDAEGTEVITIEGLLKGEELHSIQKSFVEEDGLQCGFCTPGQVMAAHALLIKNNNPTDKEIMEGMSGNLCRCGAYPNIIKSVKAAAKSYQ